MSKLIIVHATVINVHLLNLIIRNICSFYQKFFEVFGLWILYSHFWKIKFLFIKIGERGNWFSPFFRATIIKVFIELLIDTNWNSRILDAIVKLEFLAIFREQAAKAFDFFVFHLELTIHSFMAMTLLIIHIAPNIDFALGIFPT